ncbi:MAG: Rpn family recombination-promoting nuclease/putative transposase [Pseudomonadales bacterium]
MNDQQSASDSNNESNSTEEALARALLADPTSAKAIIKDQLPHEILALLEDETPVRLEGSYIDEDLQEHLTDGLFQVNLKSGGQALVFVVFEHRPKPDPYTGLHLLKCQCRIWEEYAQGDPAKLVTLPPVIPLVIYQGDEPWDLPGVMGALPDDKDQLPHGL